MAKKQAAPTNSPNREELFQMAVQAAKSGQRQSARIMFRQILQQDRRNTRAMMWMARIASNTEERRTWLNRVLEVDSSNEAAIKALDNLDHRETAERNRTLLKIGVGAYVAVVLVAAFVVILSTAFGG